MTNYVTINMVNLELITLQASGTKSVTPYVQKELISNNRTRLQKPESAMLKAVILIGGPQKGTRFRPLSLDIPKPLFPVAGLPIIQHHIEACLMIESLKEILLIGSYPSYQLENFVSKMQLQYNINIKYLQEYTPLGTAGGLFHFRDQIRIRTPDAFFVMNGDVCADFKLEELYKFHKSKGDKVLVTVMSTEATKQQSLEYGCMVIDKNSQEVKHYVEKPTSYVSSLINCGVYLFSLEIFQKIGEVFNTKQLDLSRNGNGSKEASYIALEQEILAPLSGTGTIYAFQTNNWWAQLKTAGSAIYANRHYLELYRSKHQDRLSEDSEDKKKCKIIPNVYIHPSADIHPTALLGPNVSIEDKVTIGPGVRIRESIILSGTVIESHSLIRHSIIGPFSRIGKWTRVEGTPSDPDANKPFAKMENPPLFKSDGRMNPSITILVNEPSPAPTTGIVGTAGINKGSKGKGKIIVGKITKRKWKSI